MKNVICTFICIFSISTLAQNGFTQADRENIIRIQVQMQEGFKRSDEKFEMMQTQINEIRLQIDDTRKQIDDTRKQIDDFKTTSTTMILILSTSVLAGFISIFGLILWDRRTYVAKVNEEQSQIVITLKSQQEKISLYERIFKEVSSGKPLTPELLHQFGI